MPTRACAQVHRHVKARRNATGARYQDEAVHHFAMVIRNADRRSHVRRARRTAAHPRALGPRLRLREFSRNRQASLMAAQSPRRGEARRDEAELCALSATAEILARGKTLRKFCLKSKPRNLGEKDGMFLTMCTSSRSIRCRRHGRSPGDVAAASPVPVQMRQARLPDIARPESAARPDGRGRGRGEGSGRRLESGQIAQRGVPRIVGALTERSTVPGTEKTTC